MKLGAIAFLAFLARTAFAGSLLMDGSGTFKVKIPDISTSNGVVCIVASPGTDSLLSSSTDVMSLESESPLSLTCKGLTFETKASAERTSLATISLVADSIVIDGITIGDIEAGWANSRHAQTVTALFQSRLVLEDSSSSKQTLILSVKGEVTDSIKAALIAQVEQLFEATAIDSGDKVQFSALYDIQVVSVTTPAEASEVSAMASQAAKAVAKESSLSSSLEGALAQVRASGVTSSAVDTPLVAQAYTTIQSSYAKHSRTARAKIAVWKSRAARGLSVDAFGAEAETLRSRTLTGFDAETLVAAGLPMVASYRLELRTQLEALLDTTLSDLFNNQISNLKSSTLKKFRTELLRKVNTPAENEPEEAAAAVRAASFSFQTLAKDLEVPSLSLTMAKPCREMDDALTDEMMKFPDSPAAKMKRTKQVTNVTSKNKKPGQRAIDLGVDLVAMFRPDGYGSLQGFVGYNLGGHSVTVGVQNDADDPYVISQFGGLRPPLLRFQPKLRVDVEM